MGKPFRAWINQPSNLQIYHKYHGVNVLAVIEDKYYATVYFTSGPVISMRVIRGVLSKGWINNE